MHLAIANKRPAVIGGGGGSTLPHCGVTGETLSKIIFGLGIVACGLLVLAVALILGLQFPKHVLDLLMEDLCILSSEHNLYNDWLHDTYRSRINRIYYWEVQNEADVRLNGSTPLIHERGPYIYTETQVKVGVTYSSNSVNFHLWREQTFNTELTQLECPQCQRHDQLRLMNTVYLQDVQRFGGATNLAMFHLPRTMVNTLNKLADLLGVGVSEDRLYSSLGSFEEPLDQFSSELQYPEGFHGLSFGNWIHLADVYYKSAILISRGYAAFTAIEMRGLYDAITNATRLGSLGNQAPFNVCQESFYDSYTSGYDYESCTLLICLQICQSSDIPPYVVANVTRCLSNALCTSTNSCFRVPTEDASYVKALYAYVLHHLRDFAFHHAVVLVHNDLFTVRPQEDFALGYHNNATGVHVPGILVHSGSREDAMVTSNQISLAPCYGAAHFMWKSYQDNTYLPTDYFPAATADERRLFSYRDQVPSLTELTTCHTHTVVETNFNFFMPPFWRKLDFRLSGTASQSGVFLQTFQLNESDWSVDSVFVHQAGLQNMSSILGFSSWLSLPHYLYANSELQRRWELSPTENSHGSQLSIEPISGVVWQQHLRYQLNAGIRDTDILPLTPDGAKVPVYTGPVPLYWVDESYQFTSTGVDYYKEKVNRLMVSSCAGMATFSIIACIVIITGLISGFFPTKTDTRVAPLSDDVPS